jgi:hypothetical protein
MIGMSVSFKDCFSDTTVYMSTGTDATGWARAGGFGGEIMGGGVLERCYALGEVDISASANMYIGGLVGYLQGNSVSTVVTQSYAKGEVTGKCIGETAITGAKDLFVGGLVGFANNAFIADCYALGDVYGTMRGNTDTYNSVKTVNAGGLVGLMVTTTIESCFAKAVLRVEVDSGITGGAGGIAGSKTNGTLFHNAALGASITSGVNTGRVVGLLESSPHAPAEGDNYALNTMLDPYYLNANSKIHGTRKSAEEFKNTTTWRNGLGFNQSSLTSIMPWHLTSAAALGYPTLAGLGGQ